jgi:hypothetical protein
MTQDGDKIIGSVGPPQRNFRLGSDDILGSPDVLRVQSSPITLRAGKEKVGSLHPESLNKGSAHLYAFSSLF